MINETTLLVACIVLSLVGLLLTLLFFLRRRRGRAFQAMALLFVPIGLYLTGLARLLVDGLGVLWDWARALTPNLAVWVGLVLIALAVLCWIIGSPWAAHSRTRRAIDKATGQSPNARSGRARAADDEPAPSSSRSARPAKKDSAPADEDSDDINAILKKHGIE